MVWRILCCKSSGNVFNTPSDERQKQNKGSYFGHRHIQMILYFLLLMYSYCMRSVLSVAIVAMNGNNDNSTAENDKFPVYRWNNQSIVLSAFFWGYIIFQIPAAQIGKKYGIKWLLVGSTILDSTSCILIPEMAKQLGSKGVIMCRVFQGLAQGFVLPSIHTLLSHWAPPCERSRIGTFSYAGSIFGNIISLPLTGLICSSSMGWPYAFYLWGAFGLTWTFLWIFFGFDRPRHHNTISQREKDYIEGSLGQSHEKCPKIPWTDIMTSLPVWALIIANLGINWGSSILLTQTPTYLTKILKYDITSNASLSAAPYLAMWVLSFVFSTTCDTLINRELMSRGNARKLFHSIGTLCPALGLLGMGFISEGQGSLSVAILIFVGASIGAGFSGFQVNHLDLSPNHSGLLMALSNGCTSVFSVISPVVVHFVVTDQSNQKQWRIIFIVSAAVYALTDLFFVAFASGTVQEWNDKFEDVEVVSKDKRLK